jgi:hypothetical protein
MGSKSCSAQPVSPVPPSSGLLPTMAQPAPDPSGPPPVLPIATERMRCCRPLRCTAPCRTRPTDPDPACARPWLPWTSFPHACPGLTWMEFVGSLPTKEKKNPIRLLANSFNKSQFRRRLWSGSCFTVAHAFALINRPVRRPPKHFSPLPLSFPS